MTTGITILDEGRGPQLSTSRITVQDVLPYVQLRYSHQQIREIMPSLSVAEIKVVERYIAEHFEEVMDENRRIRERNATRRNSPQVEELLRRARAKWPRLQEAFQRYCREAGDGNGPSWLMRTSKVMSTFSLSC